MQVARQGSAAAAPGEARDLVPARPAQHAEYQSLLVWGAFLSVKQQATPKPWAWDPVLYFLGSFDGKTMAPSEQEPKQCAPSPATQLCTSQVLLPHGPSNSYLNTQRVQTSLIVTNFMHVACQLDLHVQLACRLDIADAPYAATFFIDAQGRAICWIWLRDPPPENIPLADYSGCLGLPRVVTYAAVDDGSGAILHQEPMPELSSLRQQQIWHVAETSTMDVTDVQLLHMNGRQPR